MPKKIRVTMYDATADYPERDFSVSAFEGIGESIKGKQVVKYTNFRGDEELGVVVGSSNYGLFVVYFRKLVNFITAKGSLASVTPNMTHARNLEVIGTHPIDGQKFSYEQEN